MRAINKQDLINYLRKSPENLNFNIFGKMLEDFRNTYETDEQIVDKIKNIITNIIKSGGSISPEDDTITELVDLITELLPEKMIIKPEGTLEITENGTYNVVEYANTDVNVDGISVDEQYEITNSKLITANLEISDIALTIPDGVITIGNTAFMNNTIPNVVILMPNTITSIEDGKYVYPSGNYGAFYGSKIKTVVFSNNLANIGAYAFQQCTELTNITIPDSVTSIGRNAFYDCKRLTSVTIGNSVTSIGNSAFSSCQSLILLTLGNSVQSIDDAAFLGCEALTSLTIPDSVTTIGDDVFWNCRGLTSITIGNGVTTIGGNAFKNCDGLMGVTIPDSVTSIGNSAFNGCTSLTSVTIPSNVTSIGSSVFSGCTSLTSVIIDNGVMSIGVSMFSNCIGLTNVNIPDSVTSIGTSAFFGCSNLTDVYYTGTQEEWNNISIGSSNTPLTNATIHYNYTPSN